VVAAREPPTSVVEAAHTHLQGIKGSEILKRGTTLSFGTSPFKISDPLIPVTALFKRAAGYQGDPLNLPVASVDEAVPFYEQRLGFRLVERRETPVKAAILERDNVRIGLVENGGDPTQDGSFFEVDNVDSVFEELTGKGLTLSAPKVQKAGKGNYRAFFVVAPDGLCYMLGEPAP
jgi:catechol 2,3-dioxygenase-like lactoylglutathione lyase family enzyme